MAVLFSDDADFCDWLKSNPNGFVLNVAKSLRENYVVLHSGNCQWFDAGRFVQGALCERGYKKVCSDEQDDLRDWVRTNVRVDGAFTATCRCVGDAK